MTVEAKGPLIFNIRHFALDDGPGIRTTVFMKGCLLSCLWCHNPEAMSCRREIAFYPELCILCGDCEAACKERAIDIRSRKRIMRERCSSCGSCVEVCPTAALKIIGRFYTADELVEILLRDRIFYQTSGGGVTFSGGEPTLHSVYLEPVLKELKKGNIHIAFQTSGMFILDEFRTRLLPYVDRIYYDIKIIDSQIHEKYTGHNNEMILNNFTKLANETDGKIIPRIPLIPGITTTSSNLMQIADFLRSTGCLTCELLPYNSGGIEKRRFLGKPVPKELLNICLDVEKEREWSDFFSKGSCVSRYQRQ